MSALAMVIEMDEERDRKTCVNLDLKVGVANKELAQWLVDHPRYSGRVVAGWLGCNSRKIDLLRKWAREGFIGTPFDRQNKPDSRRNHRDAGARTQPELESLDNSEEVESPEIVEDNVLHTIQRSAAVASAYKKIFKVSSFDAEAKARISEAIERLIAKWKTAQSTLTRKDKHREEN